MKKINLVSLSIIIVALAACSSTTQATPTPIASTQNVAPVVSASGKVLPTRWVNLSFRAGGPIVDLKIQTGDMVKAGDLIAQLDDVDAKLAVAQADQAFDRVRRAEEEDGEDEPHQIAAGGEHFPQGPAEDGLRIVPGDGPGILGDGGSGQEEQGGGNRKPRVSHAPPW